MVTPFKTRFFKRVVSVLLIIAAVCTTVSAQDLTYTKVNRRRNISLRNCNLVDGVSRVKINKRGKAVILTGKVGKQREPYTLPQRYLYFACGEGATGDSIYAKETEESTPVEFDLSLSDFEKKPESDLSKYCSRQESLPGSFIYKTVGSEHFSDVRRNTIGLIVRPGVHASWPSCIDVRDVKGNSVAKMNLYATGGGWSARYYAGIGCGSSTAYNGSTVGNLAKKKGNSTNIYFDFGNVCYGPIDATRCVGSSQC